MEYCKGGILAKNSHIVVILPFLFCFYVHVAIPSELYDLVHKMRFIRMLS
jgi:hypothetical protein